MKVTSADILEPDSMNKNRKSLTLGRLERVDVRTAWSHEALAFTPWLARDENMSLLAEALCIDLEIDKTEKPVGKFRADIVCRDLNDTSRIVLIENQLDRSDHIHLGQLLTYACGLDAVTLVWICPKFAEEHRAAVEWLNGITAPNFSFFAIELELWRIAGSVPAPRFNVVAKPSEWARTIKAKASAIRTAETESGIRRLEYWTRFLASLKPATPIDRIPTPNSLGNLRFSLDGQRLWITVYASTSSRRIGIFVRSDEDYGRRLWKAREVLKKSLSAEFGEPPAPGEGVTFGEADPANVADRADWERQHKWLASRLYAYIVAVTGVVSDEK